MEEPIKEINWSEIQKKVVNEGERNLDDNLLDGIISQLKDKNRSNVRRAAKILYSLSESEANMNKIGNSGAIPILVSLLNSDEENPHINHRVRSYLMKTMEKLSENQLNQEKIALHGAIPQFIKIYHSEPKTDLSEIALTIIRTLSKNEKYKKMIIGAGVDKSLLKSGRPFSSIMEKAFKRRRITKIKTHSDDTGISLMDNPISKNLKRKSAPSTKRSGRVEHNEGKPELNEGKFELVEEKFEDVKSEQVDVKSEQMTTRSERSNSESTQELPRFNSSPRPTLLDENKRSKTPSPRSISSLSPRKKKLKRKSKRISDRINSASVSSEQTVRIKCALGDDKRFIWVTSVISVDELIEKIEDEYKTKLSVGQLKFPDPDAAQDLITISKREDLQLLFKKENPEVFVILTPRKLQNSGERSTSSLNSPRHNQQFSWADSVAITNSNSSPDTLTKSHTMYIRKPKSNNLNCSNGERNSLERSFSTNTPQPMNEKLQIPRTNKLQTGNQTNGTSFTSHSHPGPKLGNRSTPLNIPITGSSHGDTVESTNLEQSVTKKLSLSGKTSGNSSQVDQNRWVINSSDLKINMDEEPLGSGHFGEVRRGIWRNCQVACKFLYEKSFRNKSDMELFVLEVNILSSLRHPNVILFMGVVLDTKDKIIVTEYMENKSLYGLLKEHILPNSLILKITKDICLGMNYLHGENILHRDLTSKNILLTKHMEAKVSDFGLSKMKLEESQNSYTMGSVAYMAPEVIDNAKSFSPKSDVYSFAVVLWEEFTGQDPYPRDLAHINLANKVLRDGYRPTIPNSVPEVWKLLIERSWNQDLEKRPFFDQILSTLEEIEKNPIEDVKEEDSIGIFRSDSVELRMPDHSKSDGSDAEKSVEKLDDYCEQLSLSNSDS